MTEFLKNDPIALKQCFLYEFLQGKPFETAHIRFCKTVGSDDNQKTKEQNLIWLGQFRQRRFYDNQKPMNNIVDILRNDKNALRVCVFYEWLGAENKEVVDMMKYLSHKNKKLSVFANYQNFCKVVGEDVMEYREFESWFYRFHHGDFDLDCEKEKKEKIYELSDMPIDIMRNIVDYLDIFDLSSLANTSRSLQTFVEDQKLFHHCLQLALRCNSVTVSMDASLRIEYTGNKKIRFKRAGRREQFINNVIFWKQALMDFRNFTRNPKLHLNALTIICNLYKNAYNHRDLVLDDRVVDEFYNSLKFTHYLNVQTIYFKGRYWDLFQKVFPCLKPGYLTAISINIYPDEPNDAVMKELVEMEQWKQAKYLKMSYSSYRGPLRHLYHFKEFDVRVTRLSVDEVRDMKETLFNSPGFEKCKIELEKIELDNILDISAIGHELGDAIPESPNTYHCRIPNSSEYFEVELEIFRIQITRKN